VRHYLFFFFFFLVSLGFWAVPTILDWSAISSSSHASSLGSGGGGCFSDVLGASPSCLV
jgi:hypothetical protein